MDTLSWAQNLSVCIQKVFIEEMVLFWKSWAVKKGFKQQNYMIKIPFSEE